MVKLRDSYLSISVRIKQTDFSTLIDESYSYINIVVIKSLMYVVTVINFYCVYIISEKFYL